MSSKFYFFDTNAIARYYCNDIGSHIINQFVNSGSGLLMSSYSYVEVISALSQIRRDQSFPTFDTPQFNIAVSRFEAELDSKYLQIKVKEEQFKKAVELIKNYKIRSADALIVAASLMTADIFAAKGFELVFVTSDKEPYEVALAEAAKRPNYRAYHFWKCNCTECGNTLDVKKAKTVTCSCGTIRCNNCVIGNCTNSLRVNLNAV